MNTITRYVISLANLYGLVHKDKVVEIFNMQNDEQIEAIDMLRLKADDIQIIFEEIDSHHIEVFGDYFVHEAILQYDEFGDELEERRGKPFYIAEKNELLKYVDEAYHEETSQYKALFGYITKNFPDIDADIFCEDIQMICRFAFSIQLISKSIDSSGFIFNSEKQFNKLMQLVMNLANHTRLRENNGFTSTELFEKFEKKNMKPLPNKSFDYEDKPSNTLKKNKIGRNSPCPCGSGKKYKKCCLNKKH